MEKRMLSDKDVVRLAKVAVDLEIQKKEALGLPIIIYDRKKQQVYEKRSDGTIVVVGKRLREGRYSERKNKA